MKKIVFIIWKNKKIENKMTTELYEKLIKEIDSLKQKPEYTTEQIDNNYYIYLKETTEEKTFDSIIVLSHLIETGILRL